jgi:uncharacterized protein YgiM (DUF1202 family)
MLLLAALPVHAEEKIVYVNVPSVNIRADAGTEYMVIKSVPIGDPLRVLAEKEKWVQVESKDKTVGWVYNTMVTNDIPLPIRINQLESRLKTQIVEFDHTKKQLQDQTDINARLNSRLNEAQQELETLKRKNHQLESLDRITMAGIGIVLLLLGWGGGFITGFFKRQAEDKRFIKMMIEANSLKKTG